MTFEELALAGVFAIEPEPVLDERGLFARTYDKREFAEHGLEFEVAQASVSFNARRGTLRGMHLQTPPHEEAKLIRCVAGSVHDVVVDLRAGSPTQLQWLEVELSAKRRNALWNTTRRVVRFPKASSAASPWTWRARSRRNRMVGPDGFEPSTNGL